MMRKIRSLALLAGLAAAAAILTAPDAMAADASCVHTGAATVCQGQLSSSPQDGNFVSKQIPYWESGKH
jgi:hypothetical protein